MPAMMAANTSIFVLNVCYKCLKLNAKGALVYQKLTKPKKRFNQKAT